MKNTYYVSENLYYHIFKSNIKPGYFEVWECTKFYARVVKVFKSEKTAINYIKKKGANI